jgi:hypothetical protein
VTLGLIPRSVIKYTAALNVVTLLQKKKLKKDIKLLVDKRGKEGIADAKADAILLFQYITILVFVLIVI